MIAAAVGRFTFKTAVFGCEFVDEGDRALRTADVLARRYSWGVSTSWPLELVWRLGLLTQDVQP